MGELLNIVRAPAHSHPPYLRTFRATLTAGLAPAPAPLRTHNEVLNSLTPPPHSMPPPLSSASSCR